MENAQIVLITIILKTVNVSRMMIIALSMVTLIHQINGSQNGSQDVRKSANAVTKDIT